MSDDRKPFLRQPPPPPSINDIGTAILRLKSEFARLGLSGNFAIQLDDRDKWEFSRLAATFWAKDLCYPRVDPTGRFRTEIAGVEIKGKNEP